MKPAPWLEHRPATSSRHRVAAVLARPLIRLPTASFARVCVALGAVHEGLPARLPFRIAGGLLPAPPAVRGTVVEQIQLRRCRAEMVSGPGVLGATRTVLYFHGGAFFMGSAASHRRLVSRISLASGARVLSVDYRLAPRTSLDQQVQDGVDAYRHALSAGLVGERIALAGDSAGGWLAFAVAIAVRRAGLPAPAAVVALSPWIDLARGPTPVTGNDPVFAAAFLPVVARRLLGDPRRTPPVHDPAVADLDGLPPTLLQVGSTERLRDDAERLATRLVASGVPCRLQIWEGQPHVFPFLADLLPEGHAAIAEIGTFLRGAWQAA